MHAWLCVRMCVVKLVGLFYSYQFLSNSVQDDIKELLGACLHAEVFFGDHSKDSQEEMEPIEGDKDFPDFPNKGLPLQEGLSQFIVRYVMSA